MGRIEVELAEIEFLREMMLAEFHVRNLQWNAVQASSLAAAGLSGVASLGGGLDMRGFAWILLPCAAVIIVSRTALIYNDAYFASHANRLLNRFRRLKKE